MDREIVKIDEDKCTGCGQCVPNCHEGALQIIDGKAVLISDLMCDGLGACLGHCPEGALEIVMREAAPYDEVLVMTEMVKKSKNVVIAHLKHLKDHNEQIYLKEGVDYLLENKTSINHDITEILAVVELHQPHSGHKNETSKKIQMDIKPMNKPSGGCPGSQTQSFKMAASAVIANGETPSALAQWPVQMHLINPSGAHFQNSDFVLSADCVAYSLGGFHSKYLAGKTLGIACPKLDSNKESYLEKLVRLIDESKINTITVMIMEVPCCGGLLQIAMSACQRAQRKVPLKAITVGIRGEILNEEWL